MKIYNKIIMKWNEETQQFDDVYEDSYDYYGDIDYLASNRNKNEESKEDDEKKKDIIIPGEAKFWANWYDFLNSHEYLTPSWGNAWGSINPGAEGSNIEECFVAGTQVLMSDDSTKNIEDIEVGEYVKSYNVNTKQFESKKVLKLFTQTHNLKDGNITVKITFDNGVVTHNTIANPFWSEEKGFVAVDEERCNRVHRWVIESNNGNDIQSLDVGDTLHYFDDSDNTLKRVSVKNIEYIFEKDIRTYDINVEDNHTFLANGILTHNSTHEGPGWGAGPYTPYPCQPGFLGFGWGDSTSWPFCACHDPLGPGSYSWDCDRYNDITLD